MNVSTSQINPNYVRKYENATRFFLSSTYGINMNQNITFSGTPDQIHNGTDDSLWTGSEIVGSKATFNSSAQAHTGTKSVLWDNGSINDIIQFAKGSSVDLSGYIALTLWLYIDSDWGVDDSISIYGYNTSTAITIGSEVNIEDYADYSNFDNWQKITINLTDMSLSSSSIDAIRLKILTRGGAKSPKFYIDDFQIEETRASAAKFIVSPDSGTNLHVFKTSVLAVDAYAGTQSDGTMAKIPYNSFLGVSTLDNGILYQSNIDNEVFFSASIKQLSDFVQFPGSSIISSGSDGINSWISFTFEFAEPLVLKDSSGDSIFLEVEDDLSDLLLLRASIGGKTEYI